MSKLVTKDRQCSLALHMNRGIMRFSFVGVGSLRAFVSDVDTIGSFPSRADRPRGPSEGRGVAEGPLGRGHSPSTGAVHAFGDRMAVPERVTCPRLEWLAAGRAEFIRRETVVARRIKPWCRAAFQETAWKGTLKMVVQRPSAWLTLRLPPRASTRRRVLSMSGPTSRSSDEAGGFLRPYGAKTNPIWSVSCQMRVDVEMDAIADTT